MNSMWTPFEVKMTFLTRLVGSVPADPNLQQSWLESRKPANRPPSSKSISEVAKEVMETVEEDAEAKLLVFQRVEGCLVMRAATVRAHIKEVARTLSTLFVGKVAGEKSFNVKVLNGVYYPPQIYWLPILDENGQTIREPSGTYDKAVHFPNPRTGQQTSALKSMEFIDAGCQLKHTLMVLTQPNGKLVVNEEDLNHLFEYGGTHGYGGERGDGEGRYVAQVSKVEGQPNGLPLK